VLNCPYTTNILVPVVVGVLVKGRQDDVKQRPTVITHQAHDVVVAPVVECPFSHLKEARISLQAKFNQPST